MIRSFGGHRDQLDCPPVDGQAFDYRINSGAISCSNSIKNGSPSHRFVPLGLWVSVIFVAIVAIVGCGGVVEESAEESQGESNSVVAEKGPVKVTVEFTPHPARLSDEPQLTITLDMESGVIAELPPFGESIGEFLVLDYYQPMPKADQGREVKQVVYTLEPLRTGKLTFSPLTIEFEDRREQGDGKTHSIVTDPLVVEIQSTLESESPSLDDLQGFTEPVELPSPSRSSNGWWLVVVAILAVAGLGLVWWWMRPKVPVVERQLTPREQAYLELQAFIKADYGSKDVKLFYVELTAIVRRYIERTTGIAAPDQTTEEFLRAAHSHVAFGPQERERLAQFLESADLVKYAAHQPQKSDMELAFQRAQSFMGLISEAGSESNRGGQSHVD